MIAADSTASGVEKFYGKVKGVTGAAAGMTDGGSLSALVDEAADKLGGLDILVNNFPLQPDEPLQQVDTKLDRLLQTREALVRAASRAALPYLGKSPQGRIVNVGLLRSCFAEAGEAAYSHAERDLRGLTRALANETAESGVNTNYVQPGSIMTAASREVFRKRPALRDYCIKASYARRLGEPIDVAKVVLFLASEDAAFVNGAGVVVDGGRAEQTG